MCVDHIQITSGGIEARVERGDTLAALERCTAQVSRRAVRLDLVAGDGRTAGVDCEEVLAVRRDLEPARPGLAIHDWRRANRAEGACARHIKGRNRSVGGPGVRVRDVQVGGIRWRKLASEWTRCLGVERRTGCSREPAISPNHEAVDQERARVGGANLDSDQTRSRRVEQDVSWIGGDREWPGRAAQRRQLAVLVEGEAGVVAASGLVTRVGHVDEAVVNSDAYGLDSAR